MSTQDAAWYARLYQEKGLTGGHRVIALGSGNEDAAFLRIGCLDLVACSSVGSECDNAEHYLRAGASHVIVTSWL